MTETRMLEALFTEAACGLQSSYTQEEEAREAHRRLCESGPTAQCYASAERTLGTVRDIHNARQRHLGAMLTIARLLNAPDPEKYADDHYQRVTGQTIKERW